MALSRQQLDELKRIVASRCVALAAEIRADASRARDDSADMLAGGHLDSGDAPVADQIVDLDNAELSRDLRELRELEAAQARLDTGSYGKCVDCHEEIEYRRLRAQPAVSRCVDCQRIHENTHAHPAMPKL
ncbi:MAG: TraR/DksA family transcriptional regulator [Betaproteobacteria bacterium]|nr:TraR/DksA family transcriptional regulator [Betaproteobacteria bacterium]